MQHIAHLDIGLALLIGGIGIAFDEVATAVALLELHRTVEGLDLNLAQLDGLKKHIAGGLLIGIEDGELQLAVAELDDGVFVVVATQGRTFQKRLLVGQQGQHTLDNGRARGTIVALANDEEIVRGPCEGHIEQVEIVDGVLQMLHLVVTGINRITHA